MNLVTRIIFSALILLVVGGFAYMTWDLNSNTRVDSSIPIFVKECQDKGGQLIEKHYRAHWTCWKLDGTRVFSDEEIKGFTIDPETVNDKSIEP